MKKAIVLFFISLPILSLGQGTSFFQDLITTSSVQPSLPETDKLNNYILSLQNKKVKSEKKFLKSIFKATHQKYLKTYSQYADLGEVFQGGKFDCLTATTLFGVLLKETHFDFKIIETNYHIFILVDTKEGQVLLETTDRLSGFVEDPAEIIRRIGTYRTNTISASGEDKMYYQYSFDMFHEVRPNQLTGLLYFNRAIKAYNSHDLLACASLLAQSKHSYDSPRVEELAIILVKSVLESNLSTTLKSQIIHQYKNYVMSKSTPVASR